MRIPALKSEVELGVSLATEKRRPLLGLYPAGKSTSRGLWGGSGSSTFSSSTASVIVL